MKRHCVMPDSWLLITCAIATHSPVNAQTNQKVPTRPHAVEAANQKVDAAKHAGRGKVFLDKKMDQSAAVEYQTAVRESPHDLAYHTELARLLARLGKNCIKIPSEAEGKQADVHIARANAFYAKGEEDNATSEFQLAVSLNPAFGQAHGWLGMLLLEKSHLQKPEWHLLPVEKARLAMEGVAQEKAAMTLDPTFALPHYAMAVFYARLTFGSRRRKSSDFHDEAIKEGQEAVRLDPKDAYYRQVLGDLYVSSNDFLYDPDREQYKADREQYSVKAKEQFEAALALSKPGSEGEKRAQESLDKLTIPSK